MKHHEEKILTGDYSSFYFRRPMSFMMKQRLAWNVEWAWSQGELKNRAEIEVFTHRFFVKELLEKQQKTSHGNLLLGLAELSDDIQKILRVLSYGGRKAKDLPEQRIAFLKSQIQ
jgi:hypothetical protein